MTDLANVSLKEGYLKKRSKDSSLLKNWRRRYFRVYAGELLYYKVAQDATERRRIPLSLDTVVTKTNDQGYTCCLALKATPTGETFYMQAETEQEKEEWVVAIYEAARRTADVGQTPAAQSVFERTTPSLAQPVSPTSPMALTTPSRVLLQLNIVEARELMSADLNGKSDPYVVIRLMAKNGQVIRTEEMKTPYLTNTLNPVWNRHFTIGNTVDLRTVDSIRLELWDHDQIAVSNQSIGVVQIPLSIFQMSPASTVQSELVDRWFRIEPPAIKRLIPTAATSAWSQLSDNAMELTPWSTASSHSPTANLSIKQRGEKEEHDLMLRSHGELHVVMSIAGPNLVDFFQTHHQALGPQNRIVTEGVEHTDNRLEVTILGARQLISADLNNSSDPYVEVTLLDDNGKPIRGETFTTAVKYKTRNPAWEHEHYVFGRIRRIDEAAKLKVRVMDWDKYSANDPLGSVVIDLDTLSANHLKQWYNLEPEPGMVMRENLGQIELEIALIGETRGERQRRLKMHKEVTAKTHAQSVEQLELENAQYMLHDAACKLDGARIPCATDDYQARHPQFYGINGCIHHLNTQIPRAHRDTTSSDESFQARDGVEGHAQLEVTVLGTHNLIKQDNLTSANPYAIIELDPPICIEECKRTSAPQAHQRSKRVEAMNSAAADARNPLFSKRAHGEVSSHRTKLAKNEFRSDRHGSMEAQHKDHPVLRVEIKSGHGLSGVDFGGYSDPYCTVLITDRTTGKPIESEKKKTAVQVKTLNPVWENEVFYFGNTFPLIDTAMLLIHVKNHNNIGRATPLGRVQIPIVELCRASVTATSITTTAQEKRYPLVPEPWMKTFAESLGELCIKTEVTGDATMLAEMMQRKVEGGSPEKMMSFLSMSSFTSDPYMSESLISGNNSPDKAISQLNLLTDEEEVTEVIEKGKMARTQTAVGNSAIWRREKFTLSLSYPGMFSETKKNDKTLYTLHLRVLSARRLMGSQKIPTDWTKRNKKNKRKSLMEFWDDPSTEKRDHTGTQSVENQLHRRFGQGHGMDTNAYFTVIPVLGNGQLEHHERKQSLTVYGTRNPNWPEEEFVFGKQKDMTMISYLSLHVYTREPSTEMKRPLTELLTKQENQQRVQLSRAYIHKLGPSGQVEDDGLEILVYDQQVLAFRSCADGGRYFKARIQKYLPFPEEMYEVLFEDGVESIDDVWDLFSLDVTGTIQAVHTDGSVDVLIGGVPTKQLEVSKGETSGDELVAPKLKTTQDGKSGKEVKEEQYARRVPLSLITPVDALTPEIESVLARRMDLRKAESKRWDKFKHTLFGLKLSVLSASGLPKGVQRPGCIISFIGNPKAIVSTGGTNVNGATGKSVDVNPRGELQAKYALSCGDWKENESISYSIPFGTKSQEVDDLVLFELNSLALGRVKEEKEETEVEMEDVLIEGMDIIAQTASVLIRIVEQGTEEMPLASHPTIGMARVDLVTLQEGEQELNIKLVPPPEMEYYKYVGQLCLHLTCADTLNQQEAVQLKEALKASGHTVVAANTALKQATVIGSGAWFERRMAVEAEQQRLLANSARTVQATIGAMPTKDTITRIERRQLLRKSLTPTENAQIDAFHTVLTIIQKRAIRILQEIQLFESFEVLSKEEMLKFRHVHTVNSDPNHEWLGRMIQEMKVETRKDIVVHLEMELLDIAASDMVRVYPTSTTTREEWVQLRSVRQQELERVGMFFMKNRTNAVVLTLPHCFTGEGMISWILREPVILWKDQWIKYCTDVRMKEACKLKWEDPRLNADPDACQAPRTRIQALLWLSALADVGYIENVTPFLSVNHTDANRRYYFVEDRTDRYYRLRAVEQWVRKVNEKDKRRKSLFPLDLVREVDCYRQDVTEMAVTMASPPSSPKASPRKAGIKSGGSTTTSPKESPVKGSKEVVLEPIAAVPTVTSEYAASLRKKTYAKKLTDHVEGFLGMQNALSSALFNTEWPEFYAPVIKPVLAKTQQFVPDQLLFDWKYCLLIPMDKCIYVYERETSLTPTIIVDLHHGSCYGAYNFTYNRKGGWFDIVNATVFVKQVVVKDGDTTEEKYVEISNELQEKIMKIRSDGAKTLEFKTEDAQQWMQAVVRANIPIDMRPGQLVVLKRLNPTVLHQKCIHYVTDYTPNDLEGSFQRLLNRFYQHDIDASHQDHDKKLRDLRNTIRNEMKKAGKTGDMVMAYYGKGQKLDPKPTDDRFFTVGALYSGRIVKIRTPFTDPTYRFTQVYSLSEAPKAMQTLLTKHKITDKTSWLKIPKSMRDLFLLYDVEYRHAHEIIREEGFIREYIRMNNGDLDTNKVEERCLDLNLLYKPSDLEDCITRMVLHTGGRKPLGHLKIPIKLVSPHRIMDMWYPLAPENDMTQKAHLGHVRIQLRLVQVNQMKRSKKMPPQLLEEIKEGVLEGKIEPFYDAAIHAASVAASNVSMAAGHAWMDPLKFVKDQLLNRSKRALMQAGGMNVAPIVGFNLTRERSFVKITILEGRKLIAADYLTSDPFVKLVLVREDQREENTRLKTDIKTKTLSPKWINQEFMLGKTEATMLSDKKALVLRVMDHDLTSADDPMGCLRLEFQRDKNGHITGFLLVHADEKGNVTSRVLHFDGYKSLEVDERLLADEKAGQSKSASARGNNGAIDGKLGRLRFLIEVHANEHYVDPNAPVSPTGIGHAMKMASMMKTLETKYSLEVAMTNIVVMGKNAASFASTTIPGSVVGLGIGVINATDWRLYSCEFIPIGEGGQRIHHDMHTEDLGRGNTLKVSELLHQGTTTASGKVLGRTFDMSKVHYFTVRLFSNALGKSFEGPFKVQEKLKQPHLTPSFSNELIVLSEKDGGKDLQLQLTVDVQVIAIHRAERLKRLLAETFRLVGLQFDVRVINQQQSMVVGTAAHGEQPLLHTQVHGGHGSDVEQFLWEVGKTHMFPGRHLSQELLSMVHIMAAASKLHWKYTPQLLGLVLEHVFANGGKDRLSYGDAIVLDDLLSRWSRVLHHVNEAKNQLIGHLHGKETPRLIHALMGECDWTGFEFATLPTSSSSSGGDGGTAADVEGSDQEGYKESLLREGTRVHALLTPGLHAGVAVDLKTVMGTYIAGTIVAEFGDQSFDVAFCASAKVHEEGDEYFSDDEELPPLLLGQTVFVCPFAKDENAGISHPHTHSREPGRTGTVVRYEELLAHKDAPYEVKYNDTLDPQTEWLPRMCLDSMFYHVAAEDLCIQLSKDDFVRVVGRVSGENTTKATRPAKILKNHRTARYDIEYLDDIEPKTEKDVVRERLQPVQEHVLYEAEIRQVYLASNKPKTSSSLKEAASNLLNTTTSTGGNGFVVHYDLVLKNGDVIEGIPRDRLRTHYDPFASDEPVLASVFFSDLNVKDENSNKPTHMEMARRVNELWGQDQLVKVYVLFKNEPQAVYLRDSITNKLLQSKIHERDEKKPRFVDQCHGYTKGTSMNSAEETKLAQICASISVSKGMTKVTTGNSGNTHAGPVTEVAEFNKQHSFCLYLAPQPRMEIHGTLRLAPNPASSTSKSLFKSLLQLAVKDRISFAKVFQRLLRSTSSEHMPLNRKERVVTMKHVEIAFYRLPVVNVSVSTLTSTCSGELVEENSKGVVVTARKTMNRVPLAHVSLSVVFEIGVPHNNRGSMVDALSVAHQDATQILNRLTEYNALQLLDPNMGGGMGFGETVDNGRWVFASTQAREDHRTVVADQSSLQLEFLDQQGSKGSKPSVTMELIPLDDQRLSVVDIHGKTTELCLPLDRILVEAHLRRHVSPYYEATVLEGPIFVDPEHSGQKQINKRSRRDSLLLSKPTAGLKKTSAGGEGMAPPSYKVQYADTGKTAMVSEHSLRYDTLLVQVIQASQLSLNDKTSTGNIDVEVFLHSSDFEPQTETEDVIKTPFGMILSETGDVVKDLKGRTYPRNSTISLRKQPQSADWMAPSGDASKLSFAHPHVDMTRISGVTVKLVSRENRKLVGSTFIPLSDIAETKGYDDSYNPNVRQASAWEAFSRSVKKIVKKNEKENRIQAKEQTFSVYRTQHGQQHVVGKIKLQLERTQCIKVQDRVLAKRLEDKKDPWAISDYELLATTLKEQGDQLMRGLLATNTIIPNGDRTLLKDSIEQELQLQKIADVMMISHAMEMIYATKRTPQMPATSLTSVPVPIAGALTSPRPSLTLKDGSQATTPWVLDNIKQAVVQTKWLVEDTAAEFGIYTVGKRLPWSADHVDVEEVAAARRAQLVVVKATMGNSSIRLRRTILKLYQMYRHRLIPTLRRLYQLDAQGEQIDVKAGEQLLSFFEEEVETLDEQDLIVYRRVYQRLRLMKIAQVLHEIMQTTLRVTVMDQDPDIGDDAIGTAYIPLLDLLDQVEHDQAYELTKTRRQDQKGVIANVRSALNTHSKYNTGTTAIVPVDGPDTRINKVGRIHLRLHLTYSESSLLEQATMIYKFLKAKYIVQHETARRRINAAVVPAQRRRWMTIKGYLDELQMQAQSKLHWERTPVLLNLVWDIFTTPSDALIKKTEEEEHHLQGLAEKTNMYREAVLQVHRRWANLQPKLEELLQIQAASQIHATRTPQLLQEIEQEVDGLDLVLQTAWQQVHDKWMKLYNALEELVDMKERNKLHLARAPQLLHFVTTKCSKGLNERHAEGVSNVQFRWMAITQRDGPLCELRLMEKKGLHWRRTHELILLLNEQCEGFAEVDAKALDIVQKRWEQVQEWLDEVVQMQLQHQIDCEATPFILKKMHLLERRIKSNKPTVDKKLLLSPLASPTKRTSTSTSPTPKTPSPRRKLLQEGSVIYAQSSKRGGNRTGYVSSPQKDEMDEQDDVGRLEGLSEWYAIEEAKYELERIPYHRITTDYERNNWLPYSQDGKDTRLLITQQEMAFTPVNVRAALVDRGVIPQLALYDGLSEIGSPDAPLSPTHRERVRSPSNRMLSPTKKRSSLIGAGMGMGSSTNLTLPTATTTLPKDLLKEIQELERAIESKHLEMEQHGKDAVGLAGSSYVRWNPERVAELYLIIEGLGKSDLLWKIEHVVNMNRELSIPGNFFKLLDEMKIRQIPTTEIEELVRTLTVTLQKEELQKIGLDVPPNANFTTVLQLMHRHNVKDVHLPQETSEIQALLQERGMDKVGEPVYLRGMRIGTQSWSVEDQSVDATKRSKATAASINSGLGIVDTQIEMLRKSLLLEALRKRNSLIKTFPGESLILTQEELSECTEVDMSGDYLTLVERFQQLIITESYTKRLAEYAAMDRCMRSLLHVSRDEIVTKEDIGLALQALVSNQPHNNNSTRYRLPLEAFTREELLEAARTNKIRTPTEAMLARCPRGCNAKAMAYYAAVSHAAMVFQEVVSFRARLDPLTQRFVDAFPYETPSTVDGMMIPKNRSTLNLKEFCVEWLLGSEDSVIKIQRKMGEYHRQRLMWATAAFTLRNRWFHRGFGWCDDVSKGSGVKVLLQKLLIFENANKMHMVDTEGLLTEINDKCVNLRNRERQAKESLEQRFHANLEMLERLVGHAEKCINNRRLHTEETPALLHAIEQVCIVPLGLNSRHKEAYHVVTSAWIPHRARLAELVQMHKEGTFSIHRTPELLSAMEFHTEGLAGAEEINMDKVLAVANASNTPVDMQQQFVDKKVDEIRRGQRKQASSLQLELEDPNTEKDQVYEEMKGAGNNEDYEGSWRSLSPSKRVVQPLSPHEKHTKWAVVATDPVTKATSPVKLSGPNTIGAVSSPSKLAIKIETKNTTDFQRLLSVGDEFMEMLKSPSKWLIPTTEISNRIPPQHFFPDEVAHELSQSTENTDNVSRQ